MDDKDGFSAALQARRSELERSQGLEVLPEYNRGARRRKAVTLHDTKDSTTSKLAALHSGLASSNTWAHNPRELRHTFEGCVQNWKQYTGHKQKEHVLRLYGLYKQATCGDNRAAAPLGAVENDKWQAWKVFTGYTKEMSMRRFITFLRVVDPHLGIPPPFDAPPPGFVSTEAGEKICAMCNTARGCSRELLNADGEPIAKTLLEDYELVQDYKKLEAWIRRNTADQRCQFGRHVAITASEATQFHAWFERQEAKGFKPYVRQKLTRMVKGVMIEQYDKLHSLQKALATEPPTCSRQDVIMQLDRVNGVHNCYKNLTGEDYTYEVACTRTGRQCDNRRASEDGRNHMHAISMEKPGVDYKYYNGVRALRQECERLGMPLQTGVVKSVDERMSIFEGRITEYHRRHSVVMEAMRRRKIRMMRHPELKAEIHDFQDKQISGQLGRAVSTGSDHKALVAKLIARGANSNHETLGGMTALIRAVADSCKVSIRRYVRLAGVDVDFLNSQGMTALMWAAMTGDRGVLYELLEAGASPKCEGQFGLTPIAVAARHGKTKIVNDLFNHVVSNGTSLDGDRLLNQQNRQGQTPLMIAATFRNEEMIRHLLRKGADRHVVDYHEGRTAAGHAAAAGWTELATWLNETEISGGDDSVETFADKQRERGIAEAKARAIVALDATDMLPGSTTGVPPAATAAGRGATAALVDLVRQGVLAPDLESPEGHTPLMRVAHDSDRDATDVEVLLSLGADPLYKNRFGQTALMAACANGSVAAAGAIVWRTHQIYTTHHADSIYAPVSPGEFIAATDKYGNNAVHYANESSHARAEKVAEFLMVARGSGAEMAAQSLAGKTGEERQRAEDYEARMSLLISKGMGLASDDGDTSWHWKLDGLTRDERNALYSRLKSSDPDDLPEELRAEHDEAKRRNKRCPICTNKIPCSHFRSEEHLDAKHPDGVEWRWNYLPQSATKKKNRLFQKRRVARRNRENEAKHIAHEARREAFLEEKKRLMVDKKRALLLRGGRRSSRGSFNPTDSAAASQVAAKAAEDALKLAMEQLDLEEERAAKKAADELDVTLDDADALLHGEGSSVGSAAATMAKKLAQLDEEENGIRTFSLHHFCSELKRLYHKQDDMTEDEKEDLRKRRSGIPTDKSTASAYFAVVDIVQSKSLKEEQEGDIKADAVVPSQSVAVKQARASLFDLRDRAARGLQRIRSSGGSTKKAAGKIAVTSDERQAGALARRLRGRRPGIMVGALTARESFPPCSHCHKQRARVRCVQCETNMCDACLLRLHAAALHPHRQHHKYVPVVPVQKFRQEEWAVKKRHRANSLLGHLDSVGKAASTMKRSLHVVEELNMTGVETWEVALREEKKLSELDTELTKEQLAARRAKEAGSDLYHSPTELQLGKFLIEEARYSEAEKLLLRLVDMQGTALEPNDIAHAYTLRLMGDLEEARGEFALARCHRQSSHDMFEQQTGMAGRETQRAVNLLSKTLTAAGRYDDAVRFYLRVAEERSWALGEDHDLVERAVGAADQVRESRETLSMEAEDEVATALEAMERDPGLATAVEKGRTPGHFVALLTEPGLVSEAGRKKFKKFAKAEGAKDSLAFWLAVESFRQMRPGQEGFARQCKVLYKKYCKPVRKLNALTMAVRNELAAAMETASTPARPDLYSRAQKLVFETLFEQVYKAWLKTPRGARWHEDRIRTLYYSREIIVIQALWRMVLGRRRGAKQISDVVDDLRQQRDDERRASVQKLLLSATPEDHAAACKVQNKWRQCSARSRMRRQVEASWEALTDGGGNVYYQNKLTGGTQWDLPCERIMGSSRHELVVSGGAVGDEEQAAY